MDDFDSKALTEGYSAMARDAKREREAAEWCESLTEDVDSDA